MKILDGKKLNQEISVALAVEISKLKAKKKPLPVLAIIQVGNNESSNVYIKNKINFGNKIGVNCVVVKINENAKESLVIKKIQDLNRDKKVNGIIVQLPLPNHLLKQNILNTIDPQKDVDGLGQANLAKIINNSEGYIIPATTKGIVQLLEKNKIKIKGKNILIIGRSVLVGKTTAVTLLNHDATVTIAHRQTKNMAKHLEQNDIIICAVGKHGVINQKHHLENKVIIDVGISLKNGKILGDVKLTGDARKKLKAVSPVPGGVGPMTVASLFQNVLNAYYRQNCKYK